MAVYKVVDTEQLDTNLYAIAEVIKTKLGYDISVVDSLPKYQFPQGFIDAIGSIETGGNNADTEQLKGILEGTITELYSEATIMRDTAAGYCTALTKATLPYVKSLTRYAFRNCTSLHTVDLGNTSLTRLNINANAFNGASALTTLIIRANVVASLQATTAFTGTLIAKASDGTDGIGCIYVPSSLVDSYKAATNWSTFINQIRAIEDYPEITGGIV